MNYKTLVNLTTDVVRKWVDGQKNGYVHRLMDYWAIKVCSMCAIYMKILKLDKSLIHAWFKCFLVAAFGFAGEGEGDGDEDLEGEEEVSTLDIGKSSFAIKLQVYWWQWHGTFYC